MKRNEFIEFCRLVEEPSWQSVPFEPGDGNEIAPSTKDFTKEAENPELQKWMRITKQIIPNCEFHQYSTLMGEKYGTATILGRQLRLRANFEKSTPTIRIDYDWAANETDPDSTEELDSGTGIKKQVDPRTRPFLRLLQHLATTWKQHGWQIIANASSIKRANVYQRGLQRAGFKSVGRDQWENLNQ